MARGLLARQEFAILPAASTAMKHTTPTIEALIELANHYPSPHNGQPIELKQITDSTFTLCFQKERGLQAA